MNSESSPVCAVTSASRSVAMVESNWFATATGQTVRSTTAFCGDGKVCAGRGSGSMAMAMGTAGAATVVGIIGSTTSSTTAGIAVNMRVPSKSSLIESGTVLSPEPPDKSITVCTVGVAARPGDVRSCARLSGVSSARDRMTSRNLRENAFIVSNRSSGDFASALATMASSSAPRCGLICDGGCSTACTVWYMIELMLSASNGAVPVSASYNTTPREKISERAERLRPTTCSGDM